MRKVVKGRTPISGSDPRCSTGFSLIELLVALGLLIAVLAITPAFFGSGLSSAEFRTAARQIAAGLRATQAQAITTFRDQVFLVDLQTKRCTVGGQKAPIQLPPDIDVTLKTAESEQLDTLKGGIRFFPDGSSSGGR